MTLRLIIILIVISLKLIPNLAFSQSDTPCGAPALTVGSSCAFTTAVGGTGFTRTTVGENVADPSCVSYYASFPAFYQEDTWFSFVAPASGVVHIETEKVTGGYNKAGIALYGGPCTSLVELDCHYANSTSVYPNLNPTGLTPGATYYIRFIGEQAGAIAARPYNICVWEPATPPANDECANAIPAAVNADQFCTNVTSGTIEGATQSPESIYCNLNNNDDVWFSFVALDTLHYFSLDNIVGTTNDLWFSVHAPGFCGTTGVNALACKTTINKLSVVNNLTIGDTYYVRVWSTNNSAESATFDLCIISQPDEPTCAGNAVAGNTACTATPICNLNGYCGTTSATYSPDHWAELLNEFCGTIENNSFLSLTAIDTVISFWVWVDNSTNGNGIQIMVFSANDCSSGPVTDYVCWSPASVFDQATLIEANGLTIGEEYYIMIDGNSGDVADYKIAAHEGVEIPVNVSSSISPATSICLGESADLYAIGAATSSYTWSPAANLNSTTNDTVTSTPTSTGSYTYTAVSTSVNALCPTTMNDFTFTVVPCLLPIELINFDATYESHEVILNWATAAETNNDYFTIERSTDGIDWKQILKIPAVGNSSTNQSYQQSDPNPYLGVSYYRLKQTDINNNYIYMPTKAVEIELLKDNDLTIYPNPASSIITIEGAQASLIDFRIYDFLGQEVTHFAHINAISNKKLVLNISTFPKGIYYIKTDLTVSKFQKK